MTDFWLRFQQIVALFLLTAIVSALVFIGYRPDSYNLEVGNICNTDIYAGRTFIDTYQTEYNANVAKNTVNAIFIRSSELSEKSLKNVSDFFAILTETRKERLTDMGTVNPLFEDEISTLMVSLAAQYTEAPNEEDVRVFLFMSNSAFNFMTDRALSIAELVMMENVNEDMLGAAINSQVDSFATAFNDYSSYAVPLKNILYKLMQPNSVFDSDATEEAANNAYVTAMNDKVIIEKGTKIVSSGDVITEHLYQNLVDLELIRDSSFDAVILGRVALYEVLLMFFMALYIVKSHNNTLFDMKLIYVLIIAFVIPVAVAVYFANMSSMISGVLLFTVIASLYLGTSSGIVLSLFLNLVMWPLYSFDIDNMFVFIVGIIICSVIAGNSKRNANSASLIFIPTISTVAAGIIYNILMGITNINLVQMAVLAGVSAAFSIIIAIGLMPIYELTSKTVTPIRLIQLSQPSQPLLKRLFLEASGTHSHCMTVSMLADAAAEAIGADALLCKVASLYHDIGKLENPVYFTENQSGYNPHDELTVEESVAIITAHPLDGVNLAKKSKLPDPIIKIIDEHHGTTYPKYFYYKAKQYAADNHLPEPSVDDFRYKGHIPSSKESAIVMIADTCEAAIKSIKPQSIEEIEAIIRRLIKEKIEMDQLTGSHLSFDDIEAIVSAFKQVYIGTFHERIKYQDAN